MENWKEELEDWELYKKGDTDSLAENIDEIVRFSEDPMFDNLSEKDTEDMKSNLVFLLKQIS